MFHIGQKVVAVRTGNSNPALCERFRMAGIKLATAGQVYTIRGFYVDEPGWLGVYLEEIINEPGWFVTPAGRRVFAEPCHRSEHFRPVQDISDLEAIVAEVKRGAPRKIEGDSPLDRRQPVRAA